MIPVEGGKVDKLEKNEGRFAEAWVRCRRFFVCFALCFLAAGRVDTAK